MRKPLLEELRDFGPRESRRTSKRQVSRDSCQKNYDLEPGPQARYDS